MSSVGANVGIRAGETPPLASSDVTALRSQRRDDATSGGVGQRLKPSTIYHIIIVITFHSQEWTSVPIVCSLSHHLTSQPSVNLSTAISRLSLSLRGDQLSLRNRATPRDDAMTADVRVSVFG